MSNFKVLLKDNYWVRKWFIDVYNIASYKKLYWIIPLEVSEDFTQEI